MYCPLSQSFYCKNDLFLFAKILLLCRKLFQTKGLKLILCLTKFPVLAQNTLLFLKTDTVTPLITNNSGIGMVVLVKTIVIIFVNKGTSSFSSNILLIPTQVTRYVIGLNTGILNFIEMDLI